MAFSGRVSAYLEWHGEDIKHIIVFRLCIHQCMLTCFKVMTLSGYYNVIIYKLHEFKRIKYTSDESFHFAVLVDNVMGRGSQG